MHTFIWVEERERNTTATRLRLAHSCSKPVGQAEAAHPGAADSPRLVPAVLTAIPDSPLYSVPMHRLALMGLNRDALWFPAAPCFPLCLFSCEYIWKRIDGGWVPLTLQKEECGKGTVFSTLSDWCHSSFLLIETIHYGFEIALTT